MEFQKHFKDSLGTFPSMNNFFNVKYFLTVHNQKKNSLQEEKEFLHRDGKNT